MTHPLFWAGLRSYLQRAPRSWARLSVRLRRRLWVLALFAAVSALALSLFGWPVVPVGAAAMGLWVLLRRWRRRDRWSAAEAAPPQVSWPLQLGYFADGPVLERHARDLGPVFTIRPVFAPITCIVNLELARELLQVHAARLSTPPLTYDQLSPRGFLRSMPGSVHAQYKPSFAAAFSGPVLRVNGTVIERIIHTALLGPKPASGCAAAGIDPRTMLQDMLLRLWCRLFFDLEPGTAPYAQLVSANQLLNAFRDGDVTPAMARTSLTGLRLALNALVERRPEQDSGQTPGSFLHSLIAQTPGGALDRTQLDNLVFTFNNSLRDVHGLCTWLTWMLTTNPAWQHALLDRERACSPARSALAERMVRETLRLRQSEYLWRRALAPLEVGGWRIPKDRLIRICVRECHRDPRHFPEPQRFDPDRFLRDDMAAGNMAPFGLLHHACIGRELSLAVGRRYLHAFAGAGPWETLRDGPTCFPDPRGHWQPSLDYRIRARSHR